jgi:leader peptidase (prepilin peptidase)/N-methyltransferase
MVIIAGLFGLLWGSFLNVLIDRLPKGQDVLLGRSHCDYCKRILRWYELIPVLSFLLARGRCLRCRKPLSFQYPFIELVTATACLLIIPAVSASLPGGIAAFILFSAFLVIFVADYKYQIIPDSMIVAVAAGALIRNAADFSVQETTTRLVTGICTFVFFYALWRVTKRRGIGLGDVKLSPVLGFLLGYPDIIWALYSAFLTGALAGVILILYGTKTMKSKIAFGPFLLAGAGAVLMYRSLFLSIWNYIF